MVEDVFFLGGGGWKGFFQVGAPYNGNQQISDSTEDVPQSIWKGNFLICLIRNVTYLCGRLIFRLDEFFFGAGSVVQH